MVENGFAPLSPRRLHRVSDAPPKMEVAAPPVDPGAVGRPLEQPLESAGSAAEAAESAAATTSTIDIDAAHDEARREADAAEVVPDAAPVHAVLDEARVRAAAIGLAATACARALRYAVDRNPRLIARFVDDALRAAGSPGHAIVRLAPSAAMFADLESGHDCIADPSLATGDVFVDSTDGTLGATVEQRAAGLIRAVPS